MALSRAETDELEEILRSMSREEIVREMESRGFACYDDESKEELAKALAIDRMGGGYTART